MVNLFESVPLPAMSREEWWKTAEFVILRLLNNMAADVGMKCQEIRNVLELLLTHRPDLALMDRFSVVERQLRVTALEADRLWAECRKLDERLSPRDFTDLMFTPTTNDSQNTTQPSQPDQHQDSSSVPSQET